MSDYLKLKMGNRMKYNYLKSQFIQKIYSKISNQKYYLNQQNCIFCSKLTNSRSFFKVINKALYCKYPSSQNYNYSIQVEKLLKKKNIVQIKLQDETNLQTCSEFLNQFYTQENYQYKMIYLINYFKYHHEIPRIFKRELYKVINYYYNSKRKSEYDQVKKMLQTRLTKNTNNLVITQQQQTIEIQEKSVIWLLKDENFNVEYKQDITENCQVNQLSNQNPQKCNNDKIIEIEVENKRKNSTQILIDLLQLLSQSKDKQKKQSKAELSFLQLSFEKKQELFNNFSTQQKKQKIPSSVKQQFNFQQNILINVKINNLINDKSEPILLRQQSPNKKTVSASKIASPTLQSKKLLVDNSKQCLFSNDSLKYLIFQQQQQAIGKRIQSSLQTNHKTLSFNQKQRQSTSKESSQQNDPIKNFRKFRLSSHDSKSFKTHQLFLKNCSPSHCNLLSQLPSSTRSLYQLEQEIIKQNVRVKSPLLIQHQHTNSEHYNNAGIRQKILKNQKILNPNNKQGSSRFKPEKAAQVTTKNLFGSPGCKLYFQPNFQFID